MSTYPNQFSLRDASSLLSEVTVGLIIFDSRADAAIGMNFPAQNIVGKSFEVGDNLNSLERALGISPGVLKSSSHVSEVVNCKDTLGNARQLCITKEQITLSRVETFAILLFDLESIKTIKS